MIGTICIYTTLAYYASCCCCGCAEIYSQKYPMNARPNTRTEYINLQHRTPIPMIPMNNGELTDIERYLLDEN